jgi:hypothetical protein
MNMIFENQLLLLVYLWYVTLSVKMAQCYHLLTFHSIVYQHALLLLTKARTLSLLPILRCLNFLMGKTFLRHTIAGWLTRYIMVYMWRHSLEWLSSCATLAPAITQHKRDFLNKNAKTTKFWGLHFFLRAWWFILCFSGYDTVQSGRLLPAFQEIWTQCMSQVSQTSKHAPFFVSD